VATRSQHLNFWESFADDYFQLRIPGRYVVELKDVCLRLKFIDELGSEVSENKRIVIAVCNDVILLCKCIAGVFKLVAPPIDANPVLLRPLDSEWDDFALELVVPDGIRYEFETRDLTDRQSLINSLLRYEGVDHEQRQQHPRRTVAELAALLQVPNPATDEGANQLQLEYRSIPSVSLSYHLALYLVVVIRLVTIPSAHVADQVL
jgi:hypothetical protein